MKIKNIDVWKNMIKKRASESNQSVASVQQQYVLEEFLKKISISKYRDVFVLKGGMLVSNVLGFDNRATRDIDLTYKSICNEKMISNILEEIIQIKDNSFFQYQISNIRKCQMDDGYFGYSVSIFARNDKTKIPMKLDISNNTLIYPNAIQNGLKSIFDDTNIDIMTYTLENVIAEKLETTLDRGETNTRIRDLFDIYFLFKNHAYLIDKQTLHETLIEVSKDRGTLDNLKDIQNLLLELQESEIFNNNFNRYKNLVYPDEEISLDSILSMLYEIGSY